MRAGERAALGRTLLVASAPPAAWCVSALHALLGVDANGGAWVEHASPREGTATVVSRAAAGGSGGGGGGVGPAPGVAGVCGRRGRADVDIAALTSNKRRPTRQRPTPPPAHPRSRSTTAFFPAEAPSRSAAACEGVSFDALTRGLPAMGAGAQPYGAGGRPGACAAHGVRQRARP